eukprot:Sspe_Gene.77992::Locus_48764_Transcript_1_1_Confidence_1.000_Length_1343::g.77992::m.77992
MECLLVRISSIAVLGGAPLPKPFPLLLALCHTPAYRWAVGCNKYSFTPWDVTKETECSAPRSVPQGDEPNRFLPVLPLLPSCDAMEYKVIFLVGAPLLPSEQTPPP